MALNRISKTRSKDACSYVFPKSAKDGVEYGGWVEKICDNKYTYKEPKKGDKSSVNKGPKSDGAAASFHSHVKGIGAEDFSGAGGLINVLARRFKIGDTFVADEEGLPSYLVTPKGNIKRYDPDPKKKGNGKITGCGTVNK